MSPSKRLKTLFLSQIALLEKRNGNDHKCRGAPFAISFILSTLAPFSQPSSNLPFAGLSGSDPNLGGGCYEGTKLACKAKIRTEHCMSQLFPLNGSFYQKPREKYPGLDFLSEAKSKFQRDPSAKV